jgi:hypothetical protein
MLCLDSPRLNKNREGRLQAAFAQVNFSTLGRLRGESRSTPTAYFIGSSAARG